MKTSPFDKKLFRPQGFTLIELLTVIAVIAILAAIAFPVYRMARESARRSACASNLRQIGIASQLYADEHGGRLPVIEAEEALWPWDVSIAVMNALMQTGGGERDMFFCRSGQYGERFEHWDFGVTRPDGEEDGFRVIRYVLLFEGAVRVRPQHTNARMADPVRVLVSEGREPEYEMVPASRRELAVDAVLSIGSGEEINFHSIPGGASIPDQTNHLDGTTPLGGNVLFMDGHVAWRDFAEMDDTKVEPAPPHPMFWW
jgi:prepilin-type N-terminal cleavage/methylation domain-containing protein/prepilin-type processing-associated H-X9-DG protein